MNSSIFDSMTLKNIENLSKQIESITKNFNNNGLNQFIKIQQETLQKLNLELAPIIKLSGQIPKIDTSILEGLNRYTQAISNIMSPSLDSIRNQQKEVTKIAESMALNLPKIDFASEIFENLKNTQNLYNNYLGLNLNNISEQSFESLNKFAKEMYLNDDVDFNITYDDIEEINKKIEQKEAFTKKDLMTYIIFFMTFIGFINDCISLYTILNQDNLEHIKTQRMIQKLDNKLSKSLNQNIYYEVTKQAYVREFPDAKSKKIAESYPKQKLLIIQNKPYWLQVEYFDTHKNETIIGWISKRYTKKLD